MQLPPGQRSILSYFASSTLAEKAQQALKAAGFDETQVDRVSRYGVTNDAHYSNPLNRATTITGPTLFSGDQEEMDADTRVLLAADPSVSGYGDAGYGMAGGKAFLLTVVTGEGQVDQAVGIIKQHGGQV
ncbi:MAG TPA: hypothetical protein VMW83_14615 [Spirochaetia bacterium]|nr:hypothetical protein [Spirochaetia bacterium]